MKQSCMCMPINCKMLVHNRAAHVLDPNQNENPNTI